MRQGVEIFDAAVGDDDAVEVAEISQEAPRIAVTVYELARDYRGLRSITGRELIAALIRDGFHFRKLSQLAWS